MKVKKSVTFNGCSVCLDDQNLSLIVRSAFSQTVGEYKLL